jgi:hypothetical protein
MEERTLYHSLPEGEARPNEKETTECKGNKEEDEVRNIS